MTPKSGRGLFATRDLMKGELLLAEKALATGSEDLEKDKCVNLSYGNDKSIIEGYVNDLIYKCSQLNKHKSV